MEEFNFNIEKLVRSKIDRMIELSTDDKIKSVKNLSGKIAMNIASIESMKSSDKLTFDVNNEIYTTSLKLFKEVDISSKEGLIILMTSLCNLVGKSDMVGSIISNINSIPDNSQSSPNIGEELTPAMILGIIAYKSKQIRELSEEINALSEILSKMSNANI